MVIANEHTEEHDSSIRKLLNEENVVVPDKQNVDIQSKPDDRFPVEKPNNLKLEEAKAINEMNSFFNERYNIYKNVLAPQLEENEKLKREQKAVLMNRIFKLLKWQFIATYAFSLVFILMIGFSYFFKNRSKHNITNYRFFKILHNFYCGRINFNPVFYCSKCF